MAGPRPPNRPRQTAKGRTDKIAGKPVLPQFQPSIETAKARIALNQLVQKSSADRIELEARVSESRGLIERRGGIRKSQNADRLAELRELEKRRKRTLTPREAQVMNAGK